MTIELVALDLDGTLLDSKGKLSERNAAAIAAAQAQGVKVILATGKTYWSAVGVMATLGLALPGVFSQGMIVREADGTIMREIILDFDLVEDLLSYIERERLPLIAYNRQGLLTPENHDVQRQYLWQIRRTAALFRGTDGWQGTGAGVK